MAGDAVLRCAPGMQLKPVCPRSRPLTRPQTTRNQLSDGRTIFGYFDLHQGLSTDNKYI